MLTQADDMTADLVIAELYSRDVPVVRFDAADFPCQLTMTANIGGGRGLSGRLTTATRAADLARVRSLYYRRPSRFTFPGLDQQNARFAIAQARYGLGGVLASLPDCLYVNHPHAIADAEFKPAQLSQAVALGFDVPATVITNDPSKAREFISEHQRVVYKPLRSTEYEADGEAVTLWTCEVHADAIDDRIAGTMHLFQQAVDKKWDLRVTVAGRQIFTVRIDSACLDWRRDYEHIEYRAAQLPGEIAERVLRYLDGFGLQSGCFDFAVDLDDRHVFLECNPNGQWGWLQARTELPMAAAFANLLEKGLR